MSEIFVRIYYGTSGFSIDSHPPVQIRNKNQNLIFNIFLQKNYIIIHNCELKKEDRVPIRLLKSNWWRKIYSHHAYGGIHIYSAKFTSNETSFPSSRS